MWCYVRSLILDRHGVDSDALPRRSAGGAGLRRRTLLPLTIILHRDSDFPEFKDMLRQTKIRPDIQPQTHVVPLLLFLLQSHPQFRTRLPHGRSSPQVLAHRRQTLDELVRGTEKASLSCTYSISCLRFDSVDVLRFCAEHPWKENKEKITGRKMRRLSVTVSFSFLGVVCSENSALWQPWLSLRSSTAFLSSFFFFLPFCSVSYHRLAFTSPKPVNCVPPRSVLTSFQQQVNLNSEDAVWTPCAQHVFGGCV